MLRTSISFFNDLVAEKKNYAHGSGFNPQIVVSFFNELSTDKKTVLETSISFFNELSIEKKNYAQGFCFIF
jgi:hypothetical protein